MARAQQWLQSQVRLLARAEVRLLARAEVRRGAQVRLLALAQEWVRAQVQLSARARARARVRVRVRVSQAAALRSARAGAGTRALEVRGSGSTRGTSAGGRVQHLRGALEQEFGVARVVHRCAAIFQHQTHQFDGALSHASRARCSCVRRQLRERAHAGSCQQIASAIEEVGGELAFGVAIQAAIIAARAKVVSAAVLMLVFFRAVATNAASGDRSVRCRSEQREQ